MTSLELEQELLDVGAVGISAQRAIGRRDTVAGNDDAQRVVMVGLCHCSESLRTPHLLGLFAIADGVTVGDLFQHVPSGLLKCRAIEADGQREHAALASEVFSQLFGTLLDERGGGGCEHGVALGGDFA